MKRIIWALAGLVIVGSLGFLIYSNYVQDAELKELKELNEELTATIEEIKDDIYDLKTAEVDRDVDSKLPEFEQNLEDLNQRIQDIDDRLFNIELWQ